MIPIHKKEWEFAVKQLPNGFRRPHGSRCKVIVSKLMNGIYEPQGMKMFDFVYDGMSQNWILVDVEYLK